MQFPRDLEECVKPWFQDAQGAGGMGRCQGMGMYNKVRRTPTFPIPLEHFECRLLNTA